MPGQYTVRLTANGQSTTAQPLVVKMDPRVKTSPAGLQKKFDLEMQLASALSRGSEAVSQARSVHEQLGKLDESAKGSLKDSVEALNEKISAILGGPADSATSDSQRSRLAPANSTVIALYKEVENADSPPTTAQVEAFANAENELVAAIKRWDEIKASELPVLNQQLRAAGLPELRLDLPPQQQAGGEDEE